MNKEFTTLREMCSQEMGFNNDSWSGAVVSYESWLDVPIPQSDGEVFRLPESIKGGEFLVWTQDFVYFMDFWLDGWTVNSVTRIPEAFRNKMEQQ
jgi:hypothetical protein